jgi:hypothetical protein
MSFRAARAIERSAGCARASRVSTHSRSTGLFTPSAAVVDADIVRLDGMLR